MNLQYFVLILIVWWSAAVCKPSISFAQSFSGAGPEALGGAGRAAVNPLDSHFMNPAALAYTKDYTVGGALQFARAKEANPQNTGAIVITDNSADKILAGGFGYVHRRSSFPDKILKEQEFSLGFAGRIIPTWSLGVMGRRVFRENSAGPAWTKHNATVGTLIVPAPFLGFALVAYDILKDDDLDMIPVLALGTHVIIMDVLRLRADVTRQELRNPEHKGALHLGMELNVGSGFLIRTGGQWDELQASTHWTGGLAWEGPRLSVAYAMKNNVNTSNDTTHTFQAWLAF